MTSRKQHNSDKRDLLNPQEQPIKANSSVATKTTSTEKIPYSVAHAIPGRIRFRVPRLAVDSEYADKLKKVIESDARITSVRINPAAASIAVNYKLGDISNEQMRSHLVNLIQRAPEVVVPTESTAKSVMRAIFDALINLIDGTRNINQARNAIQYRRFRKDTWERLLSTAKTAIKGLKSATMFILPNRRSRRRSLPGGVDLQPLKLQPAGEGDVV
ncbi:hypothetical protein NUACC21_10850 [Scytonema sp. NUACC21]